VEIHKKTTGHGDQNSADQNNVESSAGGKGHVKQSPDKSHEAGKKSGKPLDNDEQGTRQVDNGHVNDSARNDVEIHKKTTGHGDQNSVDQNNVESPAGGKGHVEQERDNNDAGRSAKSRGSSEVVHGPNRKGGQAASGRVRDEEQAQGSLAKRAGATCENFPDWKDSELQACDIYGQLEGGTLLSCTLGREDSDFDDEDDDKDDSFRFMMQRLEARRSPDNAMRLSALEACCVCGGGKQVGTIVGSERIAATLWPLLLAIAGSFDGKVSEHASRLVMVGKAALLSTFRAFSHTRLIEVGKMLANVRIGEVVAGVLDVPAPVEQLLSQLIDEPAVDRVSKGIGIQPLPEITRNALNVDVTDIGEESEINNYSWWSYMQQTVLCWTHTVCVLCMLLGLYLSIQWAVDQQYHMYRLYVVLKLDEVHVRTAPDIKLQHPSDMQQHKAEQVIGFYLPSKQVAPYRLREMANALLRPCGVALHALEINDEDK